MRKKVGRQNSAPTAPAAAAAEPSESHNSSGAANGNAAPSKQKPQLPFWEVMQSLGNKWVDEGYKLYVYRKHPQIDRDGHHYVAKLREPIDPDYLLRRFGSGSYNLQINDGQGKMVAYKIETVYDPRVPPKVNPDEVTRDPINDSYWATWGSQATEKDKAKPSQNVDLPELLRAHDEGRKADQQAYQDVAAHRDELAIKYAERDNSKIDVSIIDKLLSAQKQDEGKDSSQSKIIAAIITAQSEQSQAAIAAAAEQRKADAEHWKLMLENKTPPPDQLAWLERAAQLFAPFTQASSAPSQQPAMPLEQVKEAVELFGQVRDLITPESTAAAAPVSTDGMSGWQALTASLGQSVSSALPAIAQIIAAWRVPMGAHPGQAAAAPGPAGPRSWNPYVDSAASREYVRQQQTPAAAASAVTPPFGNQQPFQSTSTGAAFYGTPAMPPQPQSPTPLVEEQGAAPSAPDASAGEAIQQQAAWLIGQAIDCLNRNVSGGMAADAIADLNGDLEYQRLVSQVRSVGIENVILFGKHIPHLSTQVTTYEPQLKQFIKEFIEPPQPDDSEEEEDIRPVVDAKPEQGRPHRAGPLK
jgi:hypothetical protein